MFGISWQYCFCVQGIVSPEKNGGYRFIWVLFISNNVPMGYKYQLCWYTMLIHYYSSMLFTSWGTTRFSPEKIWVVVFDPIPRLSSQLKTTLTNPLTPLHHSPHLSILFFSILFFLSFSLFCVGLSYTSSKLLLFYLAQCILCKVVLYWVVGWFWVDCFYL